MSSSNNNAVSTHVPILDGMNYREWAVKMRAYLWSTRLWLIVNGTTMAPTEAAALTAWTLSDSMANGNIELHLSHHIRDLVADTSAETWIALANAFGATGVSQLLEISGPWFSSASVECNIPVRR